MASVKWLSVIVMILASTSMTSSCCSSTDLVVHTKYGPVRGFTTERSQVFYGIPYASPPVGNLRWKPPQEPKPWSPSVYNATEIQPGCPDLACRSTNPAMVCPNKTAEDCLFLYVWAPLTTAASSQLPVMVYLHGGNFQHMSGGDLLYDGERFVKKSNVILVNVDYRLGALGFLVTGRPDDGDAAHGNYGIQDQRLALKWVQDNIKYFGGDPTKVTLFGQSAGAQSTAIHLTSDKSDPYFRYAIMESSPFTLPLKSFSEAIVLADIFAQLLQCNLRDMKCLRTKTAEEISLAVFESSSKLASLNILEMFEPWGPYVDGNEIEMELIDAAARGRFQKKPVMIGTTSQEARVFVYNAWRKPLSALEYIEIIVAAFPIKVTEVIEEYPPLPPTDTRDALTKLATDGIFICSTRNVTRSLVKNAHPNLWLYVFDHAFSFKGWGNFTFCDGHVCHGSEIPYVFDSVWRGGFNFTQDEAQMSDLMINYWTNFAKFGNPNNGKSARLAWPMYDGVSPSSGAQWPLAHFKTPQTTIDDNYMNAICDIWDYIIGYKSGP